MELFRAVSSAIICGLLVATLIWGGCISCDQFFMFSGSHNCCNPDGHCKKEPGKNSSGRECKQIAFDHQKAFDLHFDLPVVAVVKIELPIAASETSHYSHRPALIDSSPPDLQIVNSVFLI